MSDEQISLLEQYISLLKTWNRQLNLVSRKDEANLWQRHILHSVSVLFRVEIPKNLKVIDLGTGGGFPGIPIKILRRDVQLTLLDATRKKTEAVQQICHQLGLHDVQVIWGRAEEIGKHRRHTEQYDIVLARAVADLEDLGKWSHPFLRRASSDTLKIVHQATQIPLPAIIAYKGGSLQEELSRLHKIKSIGRVEVVNLDGIAEELQDKKLVIMTPTTGTAHVKINL